MIGARGNKNIHSEALMPLPPFAPTSLTSQGALLKVSVQQASSGILSENDGK